MPLIRASTRARCPICHASKWCSFTSDEGMAICMRVESPRPAGGTAGGWIHVLKRPDGAAGDVGRRRRAAVVLPPPAPNWTAETRRRIASAPRAPLALLSTELGLPAAVLDRLGVHWRTDAQAFGWPLTDPRSGHVVGIRLRRFGGAKFAVTGGREGLFLPLEFVGTDRAAGDLLPPAERVLVVEGGSDAAAALLLGYRAVVGRPSCSGAVEMTTAICRRRPVAILADADAAGLAGARHLAAVLSLHCPAVRVAVPPSGVKDLREWVARRGATRGEVEAAIAAAPPVRLPIRVGGVA